MTALASHPPQLLAPTPPELILWDIVDTHFYEAGFAFEQWRTSLCSPLFTLDEVAVKTEERLKGHLLALSVGGTAVAERLLYPELEEALDSDQASVAALVLLSHGDRDEWDDVFDALAYAPPEPRRGIARALRMFDAPGFTDVLRRSFESARTVREKTALLEVMADRHVDPGEDLPQCFAMDYPAIIAAALSAAGRTGRTEFIRRAEEHLDSDDEAITAAALEAGLCLGSDAAWRRCRALAAEADREAATEALLVVGLVGAPRAHQTIAQRLDDAETKEIALRALGYTGRLASAELCLPILESSDAREAKLAAEAIALITGIDVVGDLSLRLAPPSSSEETDDWADLENDDLDANLIPDAVDELPTPNPTAIIQALEAVRPQLSPEKRYLMGQPHSLQTLISALWKAPMRWRQGWALELTLRTCCKGVVTTDAYTDRQLGQLRALSGLAERDLVNYGTMG